MDRRHAVFELPRQDGELDRVLANENHNVLHVAYSATAVDGEPRHFAFVVWHDYLYGDEDQGGEEEAEALENTASVS